jgi:hypothetical protein
MKIDTEIARLFKLGSTGNPPKYESTTETERMMNLYLLYKHQFINPLHNQTIQKYKHHIRNPVVEESCEHCLYLNERLEIVKDTNEEYAELFLTHLLEMIRLHPGKKIVYDFKSSLFMNDVFHLGHSEIVVFDPATNTFEYVDSNHVPKQYSRPLKQHFIWKESREQTIRMVFRGFPTKPLYISNKCVYDDYEWGLQSLESSSELLTPQEESSGYCLMWSHLLGDLSLSFPDYSIKGIKDAILKKAYSPAVRVESINDFMLGLIRGYVKDISRELSVDFSEDTSKRNACYFLVSKL